MKKTLLLILLLSMVGVFLLFLALFLHEKEVPTQTTVPTPTPFRSQSIFPSRHPDTLPEELLKAEEDFIKKTPILQKLPYGNPYFSVDYVNEQHLIIISKTTDKEAGYGEARKWFEENGIDINTIIIEYQ